jgi:hypothetical protein
MREAAAEMQSDYHDKVAKSATTFPARWNGGSVWVRELTVSLRTLAIVVFRDHARLQHENLSVRSHTAVDVRPIRMGARRT